MRKNQIIVASTGLLNVWAETFISKEVFQRIKNNPKKIKSFEKDMAVTITTAIDEDNDCMLLVRKDLSSANSKDFESLEEVLNLLIATVEGWENPKSNNREKKFVESILENTEEASQDKRQKYVAFCKAILCDWDKSPHTYGAIIAAKFDSNNPVIPIGWISEDMLKKLLQCYVEHNS